MPARTPFFLVVAAMLTSDAHARPKVTTNANVPEGAETCGQELAASAEVPEKWGELMNHVATNMEWHARWVGADSTAAKQEHDAMLRVAREYRAMADAGERAASAMRAMKDLAPAPHDPSKLDRAAQARWMRAKIAMQRDFAALITRHANESERALTGLEGRSEGRSEGR